MLVPALGCVAGPPCGRGLSICGAALSDKAGALLISDAMAGGRCNMNRVASFV